MNTTQRHEKVSELFCAVCDLTPPEQTAYLERSCSDDPSLRSDVQVLLDEDSRAEEIVRRVSERTVPQGRDEAAIAFDPAFASNVSSQFAASATPVSSEHEGFPEIPGYQIRGVLGQGGMGVVYRATQTSLGREVALKVLPAVVVKASPSALARFKREAAAAAKLRHENIVPIFDFGDSRDGCYYAMELVSGWPLNGLIRELSKRLHTDAKLATGDPRASDAADPVSPDRSAADFMGVARPFEPAYFKQVATWVRDTAAALHFAHEQGIVHRDVKPANLIVSHDGKIVVTDFGIAAADHEEGITLTGAIVGTLRYLSPEQALGGRVPVDHRTDIYSIGATLYELLVLRPLFTVGDDRQLLAAVIGQEVGRPSSLYPAVPIDLETICLKALEKLPESRYQTANDLADDLTAFLEDRPIRARRLRLDVRLRRLVRRRATVLLAGACIVVIAGAAVMAAGGYRKARIDEKVTELISHGLVLQQDQRWVEAARSYQDVLKLDPKNVRALGNLAIIRKEQFNRLAEGNPALLEEANAYCDAALATAPMNAGIWNVKGVVLKKLGQWGDAVTAYENALASESGQPEMRIAVYNNLAEVRWLMGDNEAGESCVRMAAHAAEATGTPAWFAWQDLASLELAYRNPKAAEYIQKGFDAKKGSHWRLHLTRARICLDIDETKDIDQAVRDIHAALEQGPADPRIERTAAIAFLRANKFEEARVHAQKAVELGDLPSFAYLVLAIAEFHLGHVEAGQEHYRTAVELWPEELDEVEYIVSTERGMLWLDTAWQLERLADEALGLVDEPHDP